MSRVWTSTKGGSPAGSGPWSKLISTLAPGFQPRSGAMLTPRIRLVRPVNDGRGANIWIADHLGLATAVEVTFADRSADGRSAQASPSARSFESQSRATAAVNDPHLVRILEHGEVNGIAFLVTQLLEGKSLRRRLLQGPVSVAEVQTVVLQACDALDKAHSLGIVHGGLRPECLFAVDVANQPFIEIAGFGAPAPLANEAAVKNPYASPEQLLLGTGSDARADLWALSVSAYELLTTTLPFEAPTPAGVAVAICNGQFALASHYRADLPPGIDGWFAKALAKDPAHRHQNANELARAFVQALTIEAPASASDASDLPSFDDGSLEMDEDDGEEDEKTVRWDLPDEWSGKAIRGRRSGERAAPSPPSLTLASTPGAATLPRATAQHPAGTQPSNTVALGAAPSTLPPRMPSPALDTLGMNPLGSSTLASNRVPSAATSTMARTVPPALQPGLYLDSPYLASVASALAIPNPTARFERPLASGAPPPASNVRRSLLPRSAAASAFFSSNRDLFTADKTWLAALAFAAGVAVTWFTYDPGSESDAVVADAISESGTANIRTVSVDDLPTVSADDDREREEDLPVIIQPHQLPRATDEAGDERPIATLVPSSRPSAVPNTVAADGPSQKVQALSPTAGSNTAGSNTAGATAPRAVPPPRAKPVDARANCSPPYYFDTQGIQRLKPECLGGSAVITGPYGAVLATNAAPKPAAPAAKPQPSEKQARASANCSPPYYFDGKIRRLKLDCL
jgi:eukaryotic-like serine/threonine-protein kinase